MTASSSRAKDTWAWALYDFANSSFTTLVVTFIYGTYFTSQMVLAPDAAGLLVPDAEAGTVVWSRAVTATAIIVALLSPFMGAMADRGGARKRFLLISTVVCVAGSVGLFFAEPGEVAQAVVWFLLANVAFEMAQVFYNAYLPDIAPPEAIGRVSGYGWALGYVGGLLCLVVALFGFVGFAGIGPFVTAFSTELGENVRATNLLVAAWFALFSIPTFLVLREVEAPDRPRAGVLLRQSWGELKETARELGRFREIVRLLVARLFYNDGLVTLIAFGGIYAAGTLGFELGDVLLFGVVLNVAAMVGALGFGFVDDRVGGKRVILISLVLLTVASIMAVLTTSAAVFWASGVLAGLAIGPNQASSRSLLGRFVPDDKETEFYGFFAFSGKATAFIGPFMLGVLTDVFDSQRVGVSIVVVLFAIGGILLMRVDEQEGVRLSGRAGADDLLPDAPSSS